MSLFVHTFPVTAAESGTEWTSAMLTKGAVRDNLPPVARIELKMATHVKMGSNTSCY